MWPRGKNKLARHNSNGIIALQGHGEEPSDLYTNTSARETCLLLAESNNDQIILGCVGKLLNILEDIKQAAETTISILDPKSSIVSTTNDALKLAKGLNPKTIIAVVGDTGVGKKPFYDTSSLIFRADIHV